MNILKHIRVPDSRLKAIILFAWLVLSFYGWIGIVLFLSGSLHQSSSLDAFGAFAAVSSGALVAFIIEVFAIFRIFNGPEDWIRRLAIVVAGILTLYSAIGIWFNYHILPELFAYNF